MTDNGEITFSDEFDAATILEFMRDIVDDCKDARGGPNGYITQWVIDAAADEYDLRYTDDRLADLANQVITEALIAQNHEGETK